MIVEAALPIGAKVDWSREKTCARIRELEESTTPIELIELVLMLEDELSLSWARYALDFNTCLYPDSPFFASTSRL